MKNSLKSLFLIVIVVVITATAHLACTRKIIGIGDSVSNANHIMSFAFTSAKNSTLTADVVGKIFDTGMYAQSGYSCILTDTLPYNTDITNLKANFVLSPFATATVGGKPQLSDSTPNNFADTPVFFLVQAQNKDSARPYKVKVPVRKNSAVDFLSFGFASAENAPNIASNPDTGIIDTQAKAISVVVPSTVDVSKLVAYYTPPIGTNVMIMVDGQVDTPRVSVHDFTKPVVYNVTADDGVTYATYTVSIGSSPDFLDFRFAYSIPTNGLTQDAVGIVAATNGTVAFNDRALPATANVTALVPSFIVPKRVGVYVGSTSNALEVSGTTAHDFSNPVIYVLTDTASSGVVTTKTYIVTITNNLKTFTSFSFLAANNPATLFADVIGTIDPITHTINVTIPPGQTVPNPLALVANFTTAVGSKVTVNPNGTDVPQVSGSTSNDFTNANTTTPLQYTVWAADSTKQVYNVIVNVQLTTTAQLNTFEFVATTSSPAGSHNAGSANLTQTAQGQIAGTLTTDTTGWGITGYPVTVLVPDNVIPSALIPNFTFSGVQVTAYPVRTSSSNPPHQVSGVTPQDFTKGVVYTVIAADGTKVNYLVSVVLNSKAIASFNFLRANNPQLTADIQGVILQPAPPTTPTGAITLSNIPYAIDLTTTPLIPTFVATGLDVQVGGKTQLPTGTPSVSPAHLFASQVTYTVVARDASSTQDYIVTVTKTPPSTVDTLVSLGITTSGGTATTPLKDSMNPAGVITFITSNGTTTIKPTITPANLATVVLKDANGNLVGGIPTVASGVYMYSPITIAGTGSVALPLTCVVTAQDGVTTKTYPINVVVVAVPSFTAFGFSAADNTGDSTIMLGADISGIVSSASPYKITLPVAIPYNTSAGLHPDGTPIILLKANFVTASSNVVTVVVGGAPQVQTSGTSIIDFSIADSIPVQYIITAADGSTRTYNVTVAMVAGSVNTTIDTVKFLNTANGGVFRSDITVVPTGSAINVQVPSSADVSSLIPTFILHDTLAVITFNTGYTNVASGTAIAAATNFTNTVQYVVTPQSGAPVVYTVTVTKVPYPIFSTYQFLSATNDPKFRLNPIANGIIGALAAATTPAQIGTIQIPVSPSTPTYTGLIANYVATSGTVTLKVYTGGTLSDINTLTGGTLQTTAVSTNDFGATPPVTVGQYAASNVTYTLDDSINPLIQYTVRVGNSGLVNIPDVALRAALHLVTGLVFDTSTGYLNLALSTTGLATTSLNVSSLGIADMTGIEWFTQLTDLDCSNNVFDTINLSANTNLINLTCGSTTLKALTLASTTPLDSIDVRGAAATMWTAAFVAALPKTVTKLNCSGTAFGGAGLPGFSPLPNLARLYASNTGLTAFPTLANSVQWLIVSNNNGLPANPNISALKVSYLDMSSCGLTGTVNFTPSTTLSYLNVSNNTGLTTLNYTSGVLTDINLTNTGNLTLNISGNKFVAVPALPSQVTSLDITNQQGVLSATNPFGASGANGQYLTALKIGNNANIIGTLNVTGCTQLQDLDITGGLMTTITATGNSNLTSITAGGTHGVIAGLTNLTTLNLRNTNFITLDVSGVVNLSVLDLSKSSSSGTLTSVSLPAANGIFTMLKLDNNSSASLGVGSAGLLNLSGYTALSLVTIGGTNFSELDCVGDAALSALDLRSTQVGVLKASNSGLTGTGLQLPTAKVMTYIDISSTGLTQVGAVSGVIDLSGQKFTVGSTINLTGLAGTISKVVLDNNLFTSVPNNFSNFPSGMTELSMNGNQLSTTVAINQVPLPAGFKFDCQNNWSTGSQAVSFVPAKSGLFSLDISNNAGLSSLDVTGCGLSGNNLTVSGNPNMKTLVLRGNNYTDIPVIPSTVTLLDISGQRSNKLVGVSGVVSLAGATGLTSLRIGGNAKITQLDVTAAPLLSSIDISGNATAGLLTTLTATGCNLSTLVRDANSFHLTQPIILNLRNTNFITLDVSGVVNLSVLDLSKSSSSGTLTSVSLPAANGIFTMLKLDNNSSASLGVGSAGLLNLSGYTALSLVTIGGTNFSELDCVGDAALSALDLRSTQVGVLKASNSGLTGTGLQLPTAKVMTYIDISSTGLTQVGAVSGVIDLSGQKFTVGSTINLTGLAGTISKVVLDNNLFTSVPNNFSNFPSGMTELSMNGNQLSTTVAINQVPLPAGFKFDCQNNWSTGSQAVSFVPAKSGLFSLDISNNAGLSSLDVTGCGLSGNNLTVSGNPNMKTLVLRGNNYTDIPVIPSTVTLLDISGQRSNKLVGVSGVVSLAGATGLTSLRIGGNAKITQLDVTAAPLLSSIDISGNATAGLLTTLTATGCNLSTLVRDANSFHLTQPIILNLRNTNFITLDVSGVVNLSVLDLSKSSSSGTLTSVSLPAANGIFTMLKLDNNSSASLGVGSGTLVANNLNMSNYTALSTLSLANTNFTTLNLGNTNFSTLDVSGVANLQVLDLSKTTTTATLTGVTLPAANGIFTTLNLDNNSSASLGVGSGVPIAGTLDMSNYTALSTLSLSSTNFTTVKLTGDKFGAIPAALPTSVTTLYMDGQQAGSFTNPVTINVTNAGSLQNLYIGNNADITTLNVINTGLQLIDVRFTTATSNIATMVVTGNAALTNLNLTGNNALTSLDASNNTALTNTGLLGLGGVSNLQTLSIRGNSAFAGLPILPTNHTLTTVDISKTAMLGNVDLSSQMLTSLIADSIETLGWQLDCHGQGGGGLANQLIVIGNPGLTGLTANDCGLTGTLDLNTDATLTTLQCYNNNLTQLNITTQPNWDTLQIVNGGANDNSLLSLINVNAPVAAAQAGGIKQAQTQIPGCAVAVYRGGVLAGAGCDTYNSTIDSPAGCSP